VFAPIDRPAPAGLNVPLTARLLCNVTILVLVIERLFKTVTLVGIKTPDVVPPNARVEDAVVIKFAGVPAIVGPFKVRVFAPTVKLPAVIVRVPLSDKLAPNVIFLLELKLLKPPDIVFNVIFAPVPIVRLEVAPPVNEPVP